MTLPLTGAGPSAGGAYSAKVLSYSPIAYWPLWEAAGSAAVCQVNALQNGAYTGVTLGQTGIGDGKTCPLFDGNNDFVDIHTATLASAFNGLEGTLMIWAKSASWAAGGFRAMALLYADARNYVEIIKSASSTVQFIYEADNVRCLVEISSHAPATFQCYIVTWSDSANEMKAYLAGSQTGTTQSPDTWVGSLVGTWTNIGCTTNAVPNAVWDGHLAHCAIWDSALDATTIADLAVV